MQLTAVVDPMTLVAAHVLPPLVLYVGSQWIVGPITAAIEARRAAEEGRKKAEESGKRRGQQPRRQRSWRPFPGDVRRGRRRRMD